MSTINPADVLAYSEAATEGPWWSTDYPAVFATREGGMDEGPILLEGTDDCRPADATFIANARTDLPALAAFAQDVLALTTWSGDQFPPGMVAVGWDDIRRIATKHGIAVTA